MSAEGLSPKRILGALCVCLLVTLSACTASVDSRVAEEDTIELYVLEIEMDDGAYDLVADGLRNEGYGPERPMRDALLTDLDALGSQIGSIQYTSRNLTGDRRLIVLTLTEFSPSANSNVTLRETADGRLVYEDGMLSRDTVLGSRVGNFSAIEASYFLTMPYDIVESNADTTSGPTAEWYRPTISEPFTVRAVSRIPVPPEAALAVETEGEVAVVGESVTFDASESTDDIAVISYQWDFGDGEFTTGRVVTHQYAEPGEYTARLTVVDGDELSDVEEFRVVVAQAETPTSTPTATPEPATPTATPEPTTPSPPNGIPWLWVALGILGLVVLAAVAYLLTRSDGDDTGGEEPPDETVPPVPPSPEWSGLVIDEVRRHGDTTDVVVRNATTETWTAAGKTIEDARGNRNPLPETLAIAPGSAEILRFDRGDEEVFESEEGDEVLLHTGDGERTIHWEEPEG